MSSPSARPRRSISSQSSRLASQQQQQSTATGDALHDAGQTPAPPLAAGDRPYAPHGSSVAAAASPMLSASSMNQKIPSRSFFHRSYHGSIASGDTDQDSSRRVREQTAELASYALSDAGSIHGEGSSPLHHPLSEADSLASMDSYFGQMSEDGATTPRPPLRPDVIEEVSEPASPDVEPSTPRHSPGTSVIAEMLRHSPPKHDGKTTAAERQHGDRSRPRIAVEDSDDEAPVSVNERTRLLPKDANRYRHQGNSSGASDVEGQQSTRRRPWLARKRIVTWPKERGLALVRTATNPKTWNPKTLWEEGVVRPVSYAPPVILGLLLNILDALSYGMILFPLGQPVFAHLGAAGISIFYVSCIISQLVFSLGGSAFKGGIGSEMIEVVPFFHKMAFTILADVGEDNAKAVIATTILSYSISSIVTGLVFFAMGACKLGSLIGFFPRHILIGCIGGVGWFLVATGLEVSARLDGNLEYNVMTLKKLIRLDTVFLWTIPLALAVFLLVCQRWVKHPLFVPCYFLVIPAVFYFFVAAIPDLKLPALRDAGWVFGMPTAGEPFYHFYSLYDFRVVDWGALASTIPAMFALTFFGVLHVPINVPALGFSTGEDKVDVDRELIAHGISNALSGFAGSIQNYLVYTNSLLFIRSGGDSRVAGVMLAIGTCGILVVGPALIGYIPIMVVGALIFLLGFDLMREALYDTWGRVHRLEYLTIIAIVVTMGAWDFVIGILVGIVLACVNFVVQTSRVSAIRVTYTGEVAGSTVRRNALQRHFLREVGQQTHVTKLAGFLFFGTIVSVEKRIRALLDEDAFSKRPIRFLVLDLSHVTGIDFSAAEAFTRMNRVLATKHVTMIMCGVSRDGGEIGEALRSVGFWDEGEEVETFVDLNSALECCENQLLKAFYNRRDALVQRSAGPRLLDIPKAGGMAFSLDTSFSSPRRHHLQRAATTALNDQDVLAPSKWQNFQQPLPLILQTFQGLTDKNEDFWFRACPYLERSEFPAGTILYRRGDAANGCYLLEDGILRAEYDLPQGKYYESIVAGTTCGELPFFSETNRTATVAAERDCLAWLLDEERWEKLRKEQPDVAQELLRISLKLTSERMSAITSYVLTTAG